MKALPFKIPITSDESFLVQEGLLQHFYGILHTHPEVQITLILESTGTVFVGDYIGDFKPGDVFIIGSDCPHVFKNDEAYYKRNNQPEAHALSVFLDTELLNNELFEIPEAECFAEFITKTKKGLMTHASQFSGFRKKLLEIRDEKGFRKLILLFQIIEILSSYNQFNILLEEPIADIVDEADGRRLKDVYEYTIKNFTRPISIEEIAAIAFLTPHSFCRFFKKSTRKAFVGFLNELRINRASQLLKDKGLSISVISYKSGFNNLSHFNRRFLNIKQITPSDYRSNLS